MSFLRDYLDLIKSPSFGGSEPWRSENVVGARTVSRPLENQFLGEVIRHHGVVHTDKGNDYLIDSGKGFGTAVVEARHITNHWTTDSQIEIKRQRAVQDLFAAASGRTTK